VRAALKENAEKEKLDAAVSALEVASHKMAEEVYKAAPQPAPEGAAQAQPEGDGHQAGAKKPDGDVIDADFKVVDEKK